MVNSIVFQLCVWSTNGWEKLASKILQSTGEMLESPLVNHIEFHQDQIHLLAVHERNVHIYEAPTLNHSMQVPWLPFFFFSFFGITILKSYMKLNFITVGPTRIRSSNHICDILMRWSINIC